MIIPHALLLQSFETDNRDPQYQCYVYKSQKAYIYGKEDTRKYF